MSASSDLPGNDNGWFQHHVIKALEDLKESHDRMLDNQQEMHKANQDRMQDISDVLQDHDRSDQKMFGEFREEIEGLQPLKKIIYGAIAMILIAFLTAIIAMVITKH